MPDKYTVRIADKNAGIRKNKKNFSWVNRTIPRLYIIVKNGWNVLIIMYYAQKLHKW